MGQRKRSHFFHLECDVDFIFNRSSGGACATKWCMRNMMPVLHRGHWCIRKVFFITFGKVIKCT
jgi:hypothetical protein